MAASNASSGTATLRTVLCCAANLRCQVKMASCEDEETRALMSQQKSLAVDLYSHLQVLSC